MVEELGNCWLDEEEAFNQTQREKELEPWQNPLEMDVEEIQPKFLPDSQGNPLIYQGSRTMIIGQTQTLKSWIALTGIGNCSLRYFDFENGAGPMKKRLQALGVKSKDSAVFEFFPTREVILQRVKEMIEAHNKPDAVVFDSFHGLGSALGLNPEDNTDVGKILGQTVLPLYKAGISTIVIDHLPKRATDANDDSPIGAIAKKTQSDVVLLLRPNQMSDEMNLYITKDRFGALYDRSLDSGPIQKLGTVALIKGDTSIAVQISPEMRMYFNGVEIDSKTAGDLHRVCSYLRDFPSSAKSQIDKAVGGNHGRVSDALKMLEAAGTVIRIKDGNAHRYSLSKPLDIHREI